MEDDDREDELSANQDGRVYPLGRALRATYDADNHDTLGSDVTGLMIDLSKMPYEPEVGRHPVELPPDVPAAARSWTARLGRFLPWRHV